MWILFFLFFFYGWNADPPCKELAVFVERSSRWVLDSFLEAATGGGHKLSCSGFHYNSYNVVMAFIGMVACIYCVPNGVGSLSIGKVTSFLFLRGGGGVGHRVIMGCGTFFKAP